MVTWSPNGFAAQRSESSFLFRCSSRLGVLPPIPSRLASLQHRSVRSGSSRLGLLVLRFAWLEDLHGKAVPTPDALDHNVFHPRLPPIATGQPELTKGTRLHLEATATRGRSQRDGAREGAATT